jgi:hypothetical protein
MSEARRASRQFHPWWHLPQFLCLLIGLPVVEALCPRGVVWYVAGEWVLGVMFMFCAYKAGASLVAFLGDSLGSATSEGAQESTEEKQ